MFTQGPDLPAVSRVHVAMGINRSADGLRHLDVASPCTVSWDTMRGDGRTRFCGKCRLNVYNLAGMSRREAEQLVGQREGRVCVRFYRRPDGTVVTKDCGAAARLLARRIFAAACTFVALVLTGSAAGIHTWMTEVRLPDLGRAISMGSPLPSRPLMGEPVAVPEVPEIQGQIKMGDVAAPHLMGKIALPRPKVKKHRSR